MDLKKLQQGEKRKVWMFGWLFFGLCLLTAVEFGYPEEEDNTELSVCMELLQMIDDNGDKDNNDPEVVYCKRMLLDIMTPDKEKITT